MGRICFSSLGLGRLLDWTNFTGMFPATCSDSQLGFFFARSFLSKEVQISQWYSWVARSLWSSPMVEISDHVLPISKADMWSLWVGRCLHNLITCIAQSKSDPCRGRYLAKFRSHGTWDIWRVWRDEVDSFPFEFIWTSLFATLWDGEWAFLSLFFLKKIAPLSLADISWILWSSEWEAFSGMDCGVEIVIAGEYS